MSGKLQMGRAKLAAGQVDPPFSGSQRDQPAETYPDKNLMGLYDREYYRGDEPRGVELGGQRTMVTNLVIINVALYVLNLFIGREYWLMNDVLRATPESLVTPYLWWQLITYGFAHDPTNLMHLGWNMFGLWMFGRDVEGVYGRREFLRFYLVAILLGGLLWTARNCFAVDPQLWGRIHLLGASGAVAAVILLFCVHFPKRTVLLMFVLPVPAWVLGVLIIGGNLMGEMNSEENVAFDVHLAGAVFAICYYKFGWNFGRFLPNFSFGKTKTLFKSRPKLKIHDPDARYQDLDAKADKILQKVNRDGIESLSSKERRILEDYSRRMQQKHR